MRTPGVQGVSKSNSYIHFLSFKTQSVARSSEYQRLYCFIFPLAWGWWFLFVAVVARPGSTIFVFEPGFASRWVLGLDWAKSVRVSYTHLWFSTTTAQNISSVFDQHLLGNKCILFCIHSMAWGWWYPGEDPGMGLYRQTMRCTYL